MSSAPLYTLRVSEVCEALETSPDGLTPAEAQTRLALYGPNVLAEPPGAPLWRKLLAHTVHPMALLLWVAGAVALLGGRPLLGGVIVSVVVVNAGFSFWQEYRAERAVAALRQLLPAYARGIRSGLEERAPASEGGLG